MPVPSFLKYLRMQHQAKRQSCSLFLFLPVIIQAGVAQTSAVSANNCSGGIETTHHAYIRSVERGSVTTIPLRDTSQADEASNCVVALPKRDKGMNRETAMGRPLQIWNSSISSILGPIWKDLRGPIWSFTEWPGFCSILLGNGVTRRAGKKSASSLAGV
jgi:hypothetical protein